jgi:hypothetical protein
MKAILEFNIPEEDYEFRMAIDGHKYHSILADLVQEVRNARKHGHPFKSADEVLDWLWEELHTCVREEGVEL